eukprot:CAMPEP_0114990506 /NCGR_PEP_ID=MMETSP0216-20121206/10838_1 /TAXON_ID=223996 /ORGANISM="Protocruzia adherens, Strain Boccale" /LENGTH=524 /DNA_ID=CAMNT_0002353697 /DNA_START=175 /DNA_END=1746 /DNA_ORIENTATION=-
MTASSLRCPTCRHQFFGSISGLAKNYAILDNLVVSKDDSKIDQCVHHPKKKAKFYCETDDTMICSTCISEMHSGHILRGSRSSSKHDIDKEYNALTRRIAGCMDETLILEELIHDSEETLKSKQKFEIKTLNDKFETIIQQLDERREDLKSLIDRHYRKEFRKIQSSYTDIKTRKERLEHLNEKLESRKNSGNHFSQQAMIRAHNELKEINQGFSNPDFTLSNSTLFLDIENSGKMIASLGALHEDKLGSTADILTGFSSAQYSRILVFGDANNNVILEYDLAADRWGKLSVPPQLTLLSYTISIGLPDGRILMTGGLNSSFTNVSSSVFMYNYQTRTVTTKASLRQNRYTHALAYLQGYVYAIGGRSLNGCLTSCERYNIQANVWEMAAPMNFKRCTLTAVTVNDAFIYVFGGYDGTKRVDTIEFYEHNSNVWTILDVKMELALEAASAVQISSSEIVILGGHNNSSASAEVLSFNIQTLQWTKLVAMNFPRFLQSAYFFNGQICVLGGETGCHCCITDVGTW